MKKTIIISAIALCFSIVSVQATPVNSTVNYEVGAIFKVNSFCVSIAKGDLGTVQKLISRGADVNAKNKNYITAFLKSILNNNIKLVKYFFY